MEKNERNDSVEKTERDDSMEKTEIGNSSRTEEPVNYRGWKAMPFVIGERKEGVCFSFFFFSFSFSCICFLLLCSFFNHEIFFFKLFLSEPSALH